MTNKPTSGFTEADYRARRILLERQIAEAEQHLSAARFDLAHGCATEEGVASAEQHADGLRGLLARLDAAWPA